jgi:hypothetical protein
MKSEVLFFCLTEFLPLMIIGADQQAEARAGQGAAWRALLR